MTIRNIFLVVALFVSSAALAMGNQTDTTTTGTQSGSAQDNGQAGGRN